MQISLSLSFSEHARLRMAQRNLSASDVEYTLKNGRERRRGGAIHYTLRGKDIPKQDRSSNELKRLEGMTILIAPNDNQIITVYRNKDAYTDIRKKKLTRKNNRNSNQRRSRTKY